MIATHADEALQLLDAPSQLERALLGAIRYQANPAVLHQDPSLMPRRRAVWASWNYMRTDRVELGCGVFVTYWMNRLQGIDPAHPLFVTLNPPHQPAEDKVVGRFVYRHPLLDAEATTAQRRLWQLQGLHGTWFCGAYFGAGFHEDACRPGWRSPNSWAACGGHGKSQANRTGSACHRRILKRRNDVAELGVLYWKGLAPSVEAAAPQPRLSRLLALLRP
ncbi:MAG: hypothetical protein HC861_10385 [Rhodospirillaceae bacterium]|nr:hypothetical protein [Rhodospirillaceae bacterium]